MFKTAASSKSSTLHRWTFYSTEVLKSPSLVTAKAFLDWRDTAMLFWEQDLDRAGEVWKGSSMCQGLNASRLNIKRKASLHIHPHCTYKCLFFTDDHGKIKTSRFITRESFLPAPNIFKLLAPSQAGRALCYTDLSHSRLRKIHMWFPTNCWISRIFSEMFPSFWIISCHSMFSIVSNHDLVLCCGECSLVSPSQERSTEIDGSTRPSWRVWAFFRCFVIECICFLHLKQKARKWMKNKQVKFISYSWPFAFYTAILHAYLG